eukprot:SAG11_NODE_17344_length_521_cov_0.976303_1_plen_112_part_00
MARAGTHGAVARVLLVLLIFGGVRVVDAKKKKKGRSYKQRLAKMVKGGDDLHVAWAELTEALAPRDGDSWSLEEEGTHTLEPFSVASTDLVVALELRQVIDWQPNDAVRVT